MASINLYDIGFKHGGFAVREQTLNLKRNIVLDVSKIVRHIKERPTSSDRPEIEGRLCDFTFAALSLYRQGFLDRRVQLGVSLEEATTLFPPWVHHCMNVFFTPLRFGGVNPRVVLPDPAAAVCAQMQEWQPFAQPLKKARVA